MATKFVYSETEVQEIVAKYQANTSLEVLAEQYNKSVASIRMKLVKLGVYQKQPKTSSTTTKTTTTAAKPKNKGEILSAYETSFKLVGLALV